MKLTDWTWRTGSPKALALGALLTAGLAVAGCGPLSAGAAKASPPASAPASMAPAQGQPTTGAQTPGQQTPGQQTPGQQTPGAMVLPEWNVCYPNGTGSMSGCPPLVSGEGAYKPAVMVPDEDGSGIFRDLQWTSWTSGSATATGTEWVNNCTPNCATGTMIAYPARVTLDQPVTFDGQLYFNRLTIYFPGQTPTGRHTETQTPLTSG